MLNFHKSKTTCLMRCYGEWKDFKVSNFGSSWKVEQIIDTWNKTFEPSYIDFRKLLRELTIKNIKREFQKFYFIDEFHDYQEGNLYYGIDEDDLVCKNFVAKLLQVEKNPIQIYCWNNLQLGVGGMRVLEDKTYASSRR